MERIMYRKTLDVHKNGIQFMLQGFETADNMSRVIEISLMASGDAIDFPLENVEAIMFVKTPSASEPSINKCTIKDNKVVYEVLPIVEEGITNMQLKIIETSIDGATGILASPKFAVEVSKSDTDDESAERTTTFTALEDALAKAKAVYDERFLRMELSSDCMFRAYYADGTIYETDILKELFLNGNVLLSESYAHGGTGVRAGEDTDNSMYYSNVSRSEALNAKNIMENSEDLLEEVKLHGVYTAFKVDFESGEVVYVSPSYKFKVNLDTGELDAIGQTYTFDDEIGRLVTEWLEKNGVSISNLTTTVNEHNEKLSDLTTTVNEHGESISALEEEITPIEKGGTGATTLEEAKANLGIGQTSFEVKITTDSQNRIGETGTTDKTLSEILEAVNSGKHVYARLYNKNSDLFYDCEIPLINTSSSGCLFMGTFNFHYSGEEHNFDDFSDKFSSLVYFIKIDAESKATITEKCYGSTCIECGGYEGSYSNDDNVGEDSPSKLVFDFEPKLLYITHSNQTLLMIKHDFSDGIFDAYGQFNDIAYYHTYDESDGNINTGIGRYIVKKFDGTKVEWYVKAVDDETSVTASHQFDKAGRFYDYVAIG